MTTMKTLKLGMRGPAVAKLQHALNLMPYGHVAIREDGIFGAETAGAVQQLQSLAGLAADAIVGPQTWAAIENWLGVNLNITDADFDQTVSGTASPVPAPAPDSSSGLGVRGWLALTASALGLWGVYEWVTGRPAKKR